MMNIRVKVLLLWLFSGALTFGCATDHAARTSTKKMAQAHEQLGTSFLSERDYQAALRELLKAERSSTRTVQRFRTL
jgi:Tfp pilus assembly protein PilF